MNKINKRLLRAYITAKLLEEGVIDRAFGNEFLANDKLELDDVVSDKVEISFLGTPS